MNDNDSMTEVYVYENSQLLEQLEEMLLNNEKTMTLDKAQIDEIFRVMHTLKGSSAMMGYTNMTTLSHKVEDVFSVLRQNAEAPHEVWQAIFDLVLESVDFFKGQVAQVQEGLLPDGEIDDLLQRAIGLYDRLQSGEAAAPAEAAPAAAPAPAPAAQAAPLPAGSGSGAIALDKYNYLQAHVVFEAGCSMESVRAFAVVNDLDGMYNRIAHVPEDLNVNCDEQIIANGLWLYLETSIPEEELKSHLEATLFLQSLEVGRIEDPAAIAFKGGQAEPAPAEPAPAEPAPKPAAEAPKPAAEAPKSAPQPKSAAQKNAAQQQKPAAESKASSFLSVKVDRVDKLMDLVGEIVTAESMVSRNPEITDLHIDSFEKSTRRLRQLTDDLQDVVMSIRMVPIKATFRKMQRLVYDMSHKTGKAAELVLIGEQTEVDKNVIEQLGDPLMHMIRNSMDHGLESAEERIAAGKPEMGTITLEARNVGSDVMIIVSDDGRGLDRDVIIRKATERGLTNKPENMISDREAFSFITLPGFSTNEQVTEYSGRGVGMDVVCTNVEKMGGSLSIESEKGKGTTFTMHIPLTLAIIDGMDVTVGKNSYIIPILNIRSSFKPDINDLIVDPNGMESIIVYGECYRVIRAHSLFSVEEGITDIKEGVMLLVESENRSVCIFVDKIVGEQQVVIKPLPTMITRCMSNRDYLSGCSVMGDGSISLILDINGFTRDE